MGCASSRPHRVEGAGWPVQLPVAVLVDSRFTAVPPDTEWFFRFAVSEAAAAWRRQVVAVVGVGGRAGSSESANSLLDGRLVRVGGTIARTAAACAVILPGGAAVPCPAGATLLAAQPCSAAAAEFGDALLTQGSGLAGEWRTLVEAACVLAATPWCGGRCLDARRPPQARRELCTVRRCAPGERCAAAFRQYYDEFADVTLSASVCWAQPLAVVRPLTPAAAAQLRDGRGRALTVAL